MFILQQKIGDKMQKEAVAFFMVRTFLFLKQQEIYYTLSIVGFLILLHQHAYLIFSIVL